jgi:hypothetical protein
MSCLSQKAGVFPTTGGVCLQHVLLHSKPLPDGTPEVQGYNFDSGRDLDGIMASMLSSGFQATQLGRAIDLVNEMVCLSVSGAGPSANCPACITLMILCRRVGQPEGGSVHH